MSYQQANIADRVTRIEPGIEIGAETMAISIGGFSSALIEEIGRI